MKTLEDIEIRAVLKTEDCPEFLVSKMTTLYIQYRKKFRTEVISGREVIFGSEWTEWENAECIDETYNAQVNRPQKAANGGQDEQ